MLENYKDVFTLIFVTVWLLITVIAFAITGTTTASVIINYVMTGIIAVIIIVRRKNDRFYNWLETPLKKNK